jgi:hypothetical protein
MTTETKLETTSPQPPITLREIGRAIERKLNLVPEHNLHWVAVIGEDSMVPVAQKLWTQVHADSIVQVAVSDGHSEGTLLYVQALPDRYAPDKIEPLFRIKLLCGRMQAHKAAADLDSFLHSGEFEQLVEGRVAPPPAPIPAPVEASRRVPATGPTAANQFMQELLDSVETLSGIGEVHGVRTLADLLYLHAAILNGTHIDHVEGESAVREVVSNLASEHKWQTFIVAEGTDDGQQALLPDVARQRASGG